MTNWRPAAHRPRGEKAVQSRRGFLKSAAAAGSVMLAAPWVTTKARAAGELNVVLNQGLLAKLWIDHLHPRFEEETGAALNVQQSVTSQMLAMLKTQKENPHLARFAIRDSGSTVAAGMAIAIKEKQ